MAIVQTNINYTHEIMMSNLHELNNTYPFIQIQNVGFSVLGKSIPVIKLGHGRNQVFYSASIHAQEWITSVLLMKFIEDYCLTYVNNSSLFGVRIRDLFTQTSIYIMPMVYPDGVDLVTGFYPINSEIYRSFQSIAENFPTISFPSGYKANFNGVDFFNFQHTLLINRLDWRLLCLIILFSKFLHIRFFHYLLIYYHLLYLND